MCGLYGAIALHGELISSDAVVGAAETLVHRGPDDEGFLFGRWQDGQLAVESFRGDHSPPDVTLPDVKAAAGGYSVGFGHRRLAILDLSSAGHQPMCDPSSEVWVVYNGEIYNYVELRDELARHGHRFRSGTDTEVLLAAYKQWGPEFVQRLNGMWAFLLLDTRRGTLVGARDRFGIKPLFWRRSAERLEFASEPKALLAAPDRRPRANDAAVYEFLAWGRTDVPPRTFFEDIWQLPPAHYFVVSLSDPCQLRPERYWLPPEPGDEARGDPVEAVRSTLHDAVRLCLRSDVPLGSCLSGGLDSSAVVSLMSATLRKNGVAGKATIRTFSSCFDDPQVDERAYVESVVRASQADSTLVFPDGQHLLEELTALMHVHDEPVPGTSVFAQREVFAAARNAGITVMLDGQGGDELFAGYLTFHVFRQLDLLQDRQLRAVLREWLALRRTGTPLWQSALPLVALASPERAKLPLRWAGHGRKPPPWISPGFADALGADVVWRSNQSPNPPRKRALHDRQVYYLLNELPALLRYEDRNSMARSIEARVPFLDHRLVELAFQLPGEYKIDAGVTKRVLRQAMAGLVPDQVLARTDKMGFETPQLRWMRALSARSTPSLDARTTAFVAPDAVRSLARRLRGQQARTASTSASALWRILCLDAWVRTSDIQVA
jgi:asparagine synthase (glutamine-hydrolysing)